MSSQILSALSIVNDFVDCQRRFRRIGGYLHPLEGYTLTQLAAIGGGVGAIVEIGSYLGRSTAFLAAGSKRAGRERVIAVDHFRSLGKYQPEARFESATLARGDTTLVQGDTTFWRFQENLKEVGLDDYVTPIISKSADAAKEWKEPIRLLFIDADHSYEGCRTDFSLWSPFVVKHGLICLHDVTRHFPGVTRLFKELKQDTKSYRSILSVKSLRVVEKLG